MNEREKRIPNFQRVTRVLTKEAEIKKSRLVRRRSEEKEGWVNRRMFEHYYLLDLWDILGLDEMMWAFKRAMPNTSLYSYDSFKGLLFYHTLNEKEQPVIFRGLNRLRLWESGEYYTSIDRARGSYYKLPRPDGGFDQRPFDELMGVYYSRYENDNVSLVGFSGQIVENLTARPVVGLLLYSYWSGDQLRDSLHLEREIKGVNIRPCQRNKIKLDGLVRHDKDLLWREVEKKFLSSRVK